MITVQQFSKEIFYNNRCFYLLQEISNVSELEIMHNTPSGLVEMEAISAYMTHTGKIIIAWNSQVSLSSWYNFVAISGNKREIVNTNAIERIIDFYDRPVDSDIGVFGFSNSVVVSSPSEDWRCDAGKYGPMSFSKIVFFDELPQVVVYEPILSVNGVGHLVYIEGIGKQTAANHHVNADPIPVTGRTIQETLKLIREWEIVSLPPFSSTQDVAVKAHDFMSQLNFSTQEISDIDNHVPMQIANYITGSTNARQRPSGVSELSSQIKSSVMKRMASCSISALEYFNGGVCNLEEMILAERELLQIDRAKYAVYSSSLPPTHLSIHIQNRIFDKREQVLGMVENGTL